LFAITGVLGGFTTFSTFGLETVLLLEQGSYATAAANVGIGLAACLAGVVAGRMAARALCGIRP
ncbi:MAG: CrcB family protein, partial [Slackia sp.]|nr:CrcB family protein [Slackia sp.]